MLGKYTAGLVLFFFVCTTTAAQVKSNLTASPNQSGNSFQLFTQSNIASFCIDVKDARVVQIAAKAFVGDIEMVSDKQMIIRNDFPVNSSSVIAGTIGQSKIIDKLIANNLLEVTAIKNKW